MTTPFTFWHRITQARIAEALDRECLECEIGWPEGI
jgi:hypothetical protein